MRRPAIIFDFGNVVAHFDYARACAHFGGRNGISGDEFLAQLRERGLTPLLHDYESGRITTRAFSKSVCTLARLEDVSHEEFVAAWCDIFWLNEPVARIVSQLKHRGYRLILGSNTNDLHAAQFRRQFPATIGQFDALVLSHEVGHMKPLPQFFHACAEAAGSPPEACIFIDDLPENVEGAKAAGMTGLVYRDPEALVQQLSNLGIECANGSAEC
jgi:putative hydrolase of the HAD superfamily